MNGLPVLIFFPLIENWFNIDETKAQVLNVNKVTKEAKNQIPSFALGSCHVNKGQSIQILRHVSDPLQIFPHFGSNSKSVRKSAIWSHTNC